jgi:hypothetical protein
MSDSDTQDSATRCIGGSSLPRQFCIFASGIRDACRFQPAVT